MSNVLMDTKYHEENVILVKDPVLVEMYQSIPVSVNIDDIPFKLIDAEYSRRGGKHEPLTIGSFKRALLTLRLNDARVA